MNFLQSMRVCLDNALNYIPWVRIANASEIGNAVVVAALINLPTPAENLKGLIYYVTAADKYYVTDGNAWRELGAGGSDPYYLGFYATSAALSAAYPTAGNGYFAIVGTTDTVWVWDADTSEWKNSGSSASTFLVSDQTTKNTIADNDSLALGDSEASGVNKKTLWSTIKSTLKTYFDAIYALAGHNHSGVYDANGAAAAAQAAAIAASDATGTASSAVSAHNSAANAHGSKIHDAATQGTGINVSGQQIAFNPSGLTAKGTIADNDAFVQADSAASGAPKTTLWSVIKSTLKSYFDTLYAAVGSVGSSGPFCTTRLTEKSFLSNAYADIYSAAANIEVWAIELFNPTASVATAYINVVPSGFSTDNSTELWQLAVPPKERIRIVLPVPIPLVSGDKIRGKASAANAINVVVVGKSVSTHTYQILGSGPKYLTSAQTAFYTVTSGKSTKLGLEIIHSTHTSSEELICWMVPNGQTLGDTYKEFDQTIPTTETIMNEYPEGYPLSSGDKKTHQISVDNHFTALLVGTVEA